MWLILTPLLGVIDVRTYIITASTAAEVIQAELSKQGIEASIGIRNAPLALIYSVLTKPMFAAIDKVITSPQSKPIPYYDWAEWEKRNWM